MQLRRNVWLCVLIPAAMVLLSLAKADAAEDAPSPGTPLSPITERNLPNGLRVVLAPDQTQATATVSITYLVGARQERYGESGMAHLLEHLMFKGTDAHPHLLTELSARGMKFNGSTWQDRTTYHQTFTANQDNLAWVLGMEADRMRHLRIDTPGLKAESPVVLNELNITDTNPLRSLVKQMTAVSFDAHNYGHDPIGNRSDIEAVIPAQLQAFYEHYYQPDNAVLVVAGRFDAERLFKIVTDQFGPISRPSRAIAPTWTRDSAREGQRSITLERAGNTQMIGVLYPVAPGRHPDTAVLSVLGRMLVDDGRGRLNERLAALRLANNAQVMNFRLQEPGYMLFSADVAADADINASADAMVALIEGMGSEEISTQELSRVKQTLLREYSRIIDDPQRLSLSLAEYAAAGDWRLFFVERDRVAEVSVQDVQRVATNYFRRTNRTVGKYVRATSSSYAVMPKPVDDSDVLARYRSVQRESSAEVFDSKPQSIEARTIRTTLPAGSKLALLSKKNKGEVVTGIWMLRHGDATSLDGKAPAIELCAMMLMRGTDHSDRKEIERRLKELDARVAVKPDAQGVTIHFTTVRSNLRPTLEIIGELLKSPAFAEDELAQLKSERATRLNAQSSDPASEASRVLWQTQNRQYRKTDIRYVPDTQEAKAEIAAVTAAELRRLHKMLYGPTHLSIALVGDFDSASATAWLNSLLDGWSGTANYQHVPALPWIESKSEYVVRIPGKANAYLSARMPLRLCDDDKDYVPLQIANKVLGGTIASRLAVRLRHGDSLSYVVGSRLGVTQYGEVGGLSIYASFAPDNREKLKQALKEEIDRFVQAGISADEFDTAKRAYLEERRLARTQDEALAAGLSSQLQLNRTMEFSIEQDGQVARLRLEDVNGAIKRQLHSNEMVSVYAGDFAEKFNEP